MPTIGGMGCVADKSGALVSLRGLKVGFGSVQVLHGIDLDIRPGEALGLVGESGSGKSVTWLAALGLLPANARVSGQALLDGQDILRAGPRALSGIRGGRIGLIFQDPISALNPVRKVGAQVAEVLRLHRGLAGAQARAEAGQLFELVGIPDALRRLDAYPHEMSGGQNQRVMIAMALAGRPDLLVADEPTTALDVTIQAQILDLLDRLRREFGMALVLISHDLGVVGEVCDRVAVMYAGRVVEIAAANRIFANPLHPYTRGLLGAMPPNSGPRRRLRAIPGSVPEPWRLPPGCAFAPRCPDAIGACDDAPPSLRSLGQDHDVACIRAECARVPETLEA